MPKGNTEKEDMDLKKELLDIYTPLSEAKKEVQRRWKDKELRMAVEKFLKHKLPNFLDDGPKACLGRNIASPNFELKHFLNLTKEICLEPVFIEHVHDKFVANNTDKYHLAKLYFYNGNGKNGGCRISSMNAIDFNKCQGKALNKIRTTWGENIIDFHHRILENAYPNSLGCVSDISYMLTKKEHCLSESYHRYLALFMCGGILFENYISTKKGVEFTADVVIPSCKLLEKQFGIKPLIVPLTPLDDEVNLYWWCYPESLKKVITENEKKATKKIFPRNSVKVRSKKNA